jgi:hypothetical protein
VPSQPAAWRDVPRVCQHGLKSGAIIVGFRLS